MRGSRRTRHKSVPASSKIHHTTNSLVSFDRYTENNNDDESNSNTLVMTRKQDETKDDHVFILFYYPVLSEKCSFCTVQNCIVCALVCNLMYMPKCTVRFDFCAAIVDTTTATMTTWKKNSIEFAIESVVRSREKKNGNGKSTTITHTERALFYVNAIERNAQWCK